jgi:two-component system, response regulator
MINSMENRIVDILLVEDNEDDAGLTIRALKKHKLANDLLHLKDGAEAIEFLFSGNNNNPKLILLDIKMPKVNGIEVLQKLKSDPEKKAIPVVVLTSSKEERDIIESYRLGVNAYIVKPVNFEKFLDAVAEIGHFWLVLNQPPSKK